MPQSDLGSPVRLSLGTVEDNTFPTARMGVWGWDYTIQISRGKFTLLVLRPKVIVIRSVVCWTGIREKSFRHPIWSENMESCATQD